MLAAALLFAPHRAAAQTADEPVMVAVIVSPTSGSATDTAKQDTASTATETEKLPPSNTLITEPPAKQTTATSAPATDAAPATATQTAQPATAPAPETATQTIPAPGKKTPADKNTSQQAEKTADQPTEQPPAQATPTPPPESNEPFMLPAQYSVRSDPMLTEEDAKSRASSLRIAGYHPFVRQQKTASGDTYYVLELGRFNDLSLAVGLLLKIKQMDQNFYIAGTAAAPTATGDTSISDRLDTVLPTKTDTAEQLQLLASQAKKQNEIVTTTTTGGEGVEKLVVRRIIRPADKGVATAKAGTKSKPPVIVSAASKPPENISTTRISAAPKRSASVQQKLRNAAWNMREDGFDVFYEHEAEKLPEGVLVGVFDSENDALGLADELKSYGYTISVIQEEGGGLYQVLADPNSTVGDVSVMTDDKIKPYKQSEDFKPPSDPTANALLGLMKSGPR